MDKGEFVSRSEAETTHPLARRFVAGIRGVDIARWRDERLRQVTSGTVKRDLVLLGHVFEVARKDWGVYIRNPVRDIRLPASGRPRDRRLQPGEEDRLIAACEQARNRWLLPAVQLALETAMRQGELLSLRWEHAFFAQHGLFTLQEAHAAASQSRKGNC